MLVAKSLVLDREEGQMLLQSQWLASLKLVYMFQCIIPNFGCIQSMGEASTVTSMYSYGGICTCLMCTRSNVERTQPISWPRVIRRG